MSLPKAQRLKMERLQRWPEREAQNMCGSGRKEGRKMALGLASAWVAFAKTGNPDNEHMPHWPKYDAATRATMIFDTNTRVVNDPRSAMRKYFSENPAPATAGDD